jgi:predicted transcriptional regulator
MARPKVYDEDRVSTAVRLPASLHDRLRREASDRRVSANLIVEKAVEAYLGDRRSSADPSEARAR